MEKKDYKRLLIIGHNCLSLTGSNGRTLLNFLRGWPEDKLAQFYIHAEQPDYSVCKNYFCITDAAVCRSVLNRKPAGKIVIQESADKAGNQCSTEKKTKIQKNSLIFLAREMAWRSPFWNKDRFYDWVDRFQPECIVVQAGDAGFLLELAAILSDRYKATITVYNTEGYYFKNSSYLPENLFTKCLYPLLHRSFQKAYGQLMAKSRAVIYNCDMLKDDYEQVFHNHGHVIYISSEIVQQEKCTKRVDRIIYAGNLGVRRHKSLIDFAEALHSISDEYYLDVYGKTSDINIEKELKACQAIRYNGFAPYSVIKKEITECKYLLHAESFEPEINEDLKYAFSTKIADSLASGALLFLYAPRNMAVAQYLADTGAAAMITNKEELIPSIQRFIQDDALADECIHKALSLAQKNHDIVINRDKFQKIINEWDSV